MMQKGKDVRVSTHHPNLENYADDRNEPWLFDNVSIEFIVPNSEEDKETLRARVYQNASGTIQPFDVTVYQYDSTSINVTDLIAIFKAIIVFLNGGDYSDPFVNDPKKAAKVIPRTTKIKPYRGKTKIENRGFDDQHLQYIAEQCMKGIIEINHNRNMNKKLIRLTESDLHRIVKESVNKVLYEIDNRNFELRKGLFGEISYLELLDEYVLYYGDEIYFNLNTNSYVDFFPKQIKGKKKFDSYEEVIEFCKENGIEVFKNDKISHSLSKGLPDTRSISDDMARYL